AHARATGESAFVPRPSHGGPARASSCPFGSSLSTPPAVGLNPFPAGRWRRGQREIENRKHLPITTTTADGDDLLVSVQIDPLYGDRDSKDRRRERHPQVLVDHREPARRLFRLVVAVDRRLLDHLLES